jgi:tetrapyrrole methylase family protein/MazG family protein
LCFRRLIGALRFTEIRLGFLLMPSQFEQFCKTIATLRGPDGCPWDREQTYKSLTRYLIEETYEVLDAVNSEDFDKLKDELGDLLLQIVLQAQLGSEQGHFNIDDVVQAINTKMINRHPHVFSDKKLETSREVLLEWEKLKEVEKQKAVNGNNTDAILDSALANIPNGLPALLKALKISEKAVHQGFEWEKEEDIWKQLLSEIEEFKEETNKLKDNCDGIANSKQKEERQSSVANEDIYLEMGDILFTMVNIARWYKIDPEEALLLTIEKFKQRFKLMENRAKGSLKELTISQWEELWKQAKDDLKAATNIERA